MKLGSKLSFGQFIFSQLCILVIGLLFLSWLHFQLNIQYQPPTTKFSYGPITSPPRTLTLDLAQPEEDTLTFEDSSVVSGKTGSFLDILIFTPNSDTVIKSNKEGTFSTVLNLEEGENKITVAVFDKTGDSRSLERTVYYSKEKI